MSVAADVAMEKRMRHIDVATRSDYTHLKQVLLDAALRFSDVADEIEKNQNYDPVAFLRASAARCKAEVDAV